MSLCLFNLYARNTEMEVTQPGINIAWKTINNCIYADDTNLMAENEELKNLYKKVKEESQKVDLKPNIQETKIMVSIQFSRSVVSSFL